MKSNDIQLSILIPTFNRLNLLELAIERLILKGYFNHEKIEILISDNCSSDGTKDFLVSKNLNHFSQKENLGYARNLTSLLENAKGKYTWIIGDDDLVLLSADRLIDLITSDLDFQFYVFGEEINIFSRDAFTVADMHGVLSMPFGFISNVIQKNSEDFLILCKSHIGLNSHDSPHFFARWYLWTKNRCSGVYYNELLVESMPVNTSRFSNYKDLFSVGKYDRSFNWYSAYVESLKISELSNFLPLLVREIIFNNLYSSYKKNPFRFIFYWILRLYHGFFIKRDYSIFIMRELLRVIFKKNILNKGDSGSIL